MTPIPGQLSPCNNLGLSLDILMSIFKRKSCQMTNIYGSVNSLFYGSARNIQIILFKLFQRQGIEFKQLYFNSLWKCMVSYAKATTQYHPSSDYESDIALFAEHCDILANVIFLLFASASQNKVQNLFFVQIR